MAAIKSTPLCSEPPVIGETLSIEESVPVVPACVEVGNGCTDDSPKVSRLVIML